MILNSDELSFLLRTISLSYWLYVWSNLIASPWPCHEVFSTYVYYVECAIIDQSISRGSLAYESIESTFLYLYIPLFNLKNMLYVFVYARTALLTFTHFFNSVYLPDVLFWSFCSYFVLSNSTVCQISNPYYIWISAKGSHQTCDVIKIRKWFHLNTKFTSKTYFRYQIFLKTRNTFLLLNITVVLGVVWCYCCIRQVWNNCLVYLYYTIN